MPRYRKPVFEEMDLRTRQHLFEQWALVHKFQILLERTESHHPLDAGAVVPGTVEQTNLPGGGEMSGKALQIPLGLFALGGLGERNHAGRSRAHMLGKTLDRAAFSGSIAALEQHHD